MNRWPVVAFSILIIGAIGGAAYLGSQNRQPETTAVPSQPTTVNVTRGIVQQTVTAPGQVVGVQEVVLGMTVGGALAEVNIRPGSQVKAGETLARLNTRPLEEALIDAQLHLSQAQAEHARRLTEAQLNRAIIESQLRQANLETIDLASSEANLAAAQAHLQAVLAPHNEDRQTIAAAGLKRAEIALQGAQGAYDRVAYSGDAGQSFEGRQLQEATLQYETALAEYNLATQGPTPAEITAAQANVGQAQAEVERLRLAAQSHLEQLEALQAQVQQAIIAQERLEEGVDPFLQRAVEQAEENLAAAALTAPFDGVVAEALVRSGARVDAGSPILVLVNPNAIEVRTTVIEEDLPFVKVGQPAEIFFDAEPAEAILGRVARIVPQRVAGENRPLYYVYLTPDFVPQTILPGMTADAAIIIAQADDVLRLPRAIVRAGSSNTASLHLWQNGQEVSREVEVGLRGDIYIEIVDGVREGDEVVGE